MTWELIDGKRQADRQTDGGSGGGCGGGDVVDYSSVGRSGRVDGWKGKLDGYVLRYGSRKGGM